MRKLLLIILTACQPALDREAIPAAADAPAPPVALPSARHGHRLEPLVGGLLCFGGFARGSRAADRGKRETWFLDNGSDTWSRCGDLTHVHAFFASIVIDGEAYAIGESIERYDAARDRWLVVTAPGQLPRSHLAATAHNGEIHVLGGLPQVGTGFSIVDPASGLVRHAAPPPTFTHGDHMHLLCSLGGELHVFGGMRDHPWGVSNEHWVRRGESWHRLPDCPVGVWMKFGMQAVHAGRLYLFGEFGAFRFDPVPGTWRALSPPPAMIAMPATVTIGDDIWVVGGQLVPGSGNVLWRYDILDDRWQDLSGAYTR